jgi:hypothetical protein
MVIRVGRLSPLELAPADRPREANQKSSISKSKSLPVTRIHLGEISACRETASLASFRQLGAAVFP